MNRREFLKAGAGGAMAFGPGIRGWAQGGPRKAVVIGHTGRGDYGHGLEAIFQNRPGIVLAGLADPDPAGRARMADKLKPGRAYADYREMLEVERPELVSIAMRHADQHRDIGLAALRAGAHVYMEKPLTRFPAEADELLAEAGRRGLRMAVAHTMRMAPGVVRFRKALQEGLIGDLVEMRAYGKQDTRAGGEDMMVLGSHLFDLMRLFAGDPLWCMARIDWHGNPVRVEDRRLVKDNVGWVAGDSVFAQFAFPSGVSATFTSDARLKATVGHWGIEFHGSRGVARVNCDVAPNVFVRQHAEWKAGGRNDTWVPLEQAKVPSSDHGSGPVDDWLEAIRHGREPECSGRNAAWAVEMVMAVYHAALGGSRIRFPLQRRDHALG